MAKDHESPKLPTAEFVSMARRLADFVRPLGDIVAFAEDVAAHENAARKALQQVEFAHEEEARTREDIARAKAQAEKDAAGARVVLEHDLGDLTAQITASKAEVRRQQERADEAVALAEARVAKAEAAHAAAMATLTKELRELEGKIASLRTEELAIRERLTAALR